VNFTPKTQAKEEGKDTIRYVERSDEVKTWVVLFWNVAVLWQSRNDGR